MGFSRFFRRRAWDEERALEIDAYIEEETAENIARGMSPDEARFAARRKFGNDMAVREQIYDFNTLAWLESLAQDLRHGARLLGRNPGFATVAILSLALGIGANTAIFQLLNAVRLKTLPVHNPQELVVVEIADMSAARGNFFTWNPSLTNPIWENLRDRQQAFSGMLAWYPDEFNLSTSGEYRGALGLLVSGDFFNVLGLHAARGRLFSAADDKRGCGSISAVISYSFWQREFGGDPHIVGRKLTLDYQPAEIIGVAPAGFEGLDVGKTFDVAIPLCAEAIGAENSRLDQRHSWWLTVMGRLKPGVSAQQAVAQLNAISRPIMEATAPTEWDSASIQKYREFKLTAHPAAAGISLLRHTYEDPLILLLALAAIVLLIACANLANLLLARSSARSREIAVRMAIGASRGRLVRQLFSESLLLAILGAVAGIVLARWLSHALLLLLKTGARGPSLDLGMDWRLLAFATGLATLTAIIFGLAPALTTTRTSPMSMMSSGARSTSGRDRFLLRRMLVVSQVALSLVLLFGALLFVRSLSNILTVNPGMQTKGTLVGFCSWNRVDVPPDQRLAYERSILERLRAVPGVSGVAAVSVVPLVGWGWNNHMWMDGQPQRSDESAVSWASRVTPGYFGMMGMTLLSGRDFDESRDTNSAPMVAVVNETFAQKFAGTPNAIGKRFWVEATPTDKERLLEIVGIVADTNYRDVRETEHLPIVFFPQMQNPKPGKFTNLLVRSSLPAEAIMPSLRKTLGDLNPNIVTNWTSLETMIRNGTLQERLLAELSTFFGLLAGLLAVVGLYGVMSYIVARRTNEIGVRMALGATRGGVVALVLREALLLLAGGVVVGAVLSLFAARAAATMLFGLKPHDPLTLAAAVLLLGLVSVVASFLPARRAAKVDPIVALRAE